MSAIDTPLRFGIIGLGLQGASHLANIGHEARATVTAICDRDESLLASWGESLSVSHRFTDYRELVRCEAVDAVVVALPDHLHAEAAVAALEAGRHLLLEKPMATAVDQAEAVAAAARAGGGRFMLNLSNRWMPAFAAGKHRLDSGELGAPRYIFSRMANRLVLPTEQLPWLQHSHLAHWTGVHRLDIARWYLGDEPVRVRALERRGVLEARGFDTADLYQATIEFAGGAVMTLEGSWILPDTWPNAVDSRFYTLCERGVIDVDRLRSELMVVGDEAVDMNTPLAGERLGRRAGFTCEALRHFVDCCLEGRDPMIGADDGLALTRALCAIVSSCANDGEIVEIERVK